MLRSDKAINMDLVQNTLFVSGYWEVVGNQKRKHDVYLNNLKDTLKMIKGGRLIFYTSVMDKADEITAICNALNIDVQVIESSISSLPAAETAERFTEQASKMNIDDLMFLTLPSKEKGVAHSKRDLKPDAFVYEQMLTIWLSKVYLVAKHSESSEFTAWIDSGFSRFNFYRERWNIRKLQVLRNKLMHYGSYMTFLGESLPLNASFLLGDKRTWSNILNEYVASLNRFNALPYAVDEEVIFAEVYARNSSLFHLIGSPYKLNGKLQREIHWHYVKLMKIFSTHY